MSIPHKCLLSLVFASTALYCPVDAFCQSPSSTKQLIERLGTFEKQFWGVTCQYWQETKGWERTSTHWFSMSKDGLFFRNGYDSTSESENGITRRAAEIVQIPGQRIAALASGDGSELLPFELRGRTDYDRFDMGLEIFGVSRLDGLRFTAIAKDKDSVATKKEEMLDGATLDVLVIEGPRKGKYEFYFSREAPFLVQKIVVDKLADDIVWDPQANKLVALSEPLENVQGTASRDRVVWYPIEYEDYKGESRVSRAGSTRHVDHDGGQTELTHDFIVEELSDFYIRDSSRAKFDRMSVKDDMPVFVKGAEGLSFVYRDGRIERAHDVAGIKAIDGIRFREPKSNWRWYTGLFVALIAISAVFLFAKRRKE